jgi:hypothetical protein
MNHEDTANHKVRLWDIVKRGIELADGYILFVVVYFAVDYLVWFGVTRLETHFIGPVQDVPPDLTRVIPFLLAFWITSSLVQAFMDCIIARLLGKAVLLIEPDAGLLLGHTVRRFYLRMLLLSAIHGILLIVALPLYLAAYCVLRYVAAFVIWRDCTVPAAFSGFSDFLSAHLGKFMPVWLVGAVVLMGTNLAAGSPASSNLVFMGLLHLVVAYFDFAVMAVALLSFTMLQNNRQEALA